MAPNNSHHYQRIAQAVEYLQTNSTQQPSLDDTAAVVHLSPHHFQRLFTQWAGVSPKKFTQYLSLEHAKQLLASPTTSVLDAAHETGLSSGSRLHDLFVSIEAMTPGEFKRGGSGLDINYSYAPSPFGQVIVASTQKGVCHLFFEQDKTKAFIDLQQRYPNAQYHQRCDAHQQTALAIFNKDWRQLDQIKLHLKATPFQLHVWQGLLKIPHGQLRSYSELANTINKPTAARAVGSAIGRNPIAFLIPCHRVIQASGHKGGYMWGQTRKSAIIGWESARESF